MYTLQRGLVLENLLYWKSSGKDSELFVTLGKMFNVLLVQTGRVTLTPKPQQPPSPSVQKGTGLWKNDWVCMFETDSKEEGV